MVNDKEALEIRAILALEKEGFTEDEIGRALKFSERTLRRRRAKNKAMRRRHRPMAVAG